jgi:hypothetical protein
LGQPDKLLRVLPDVLNVNPEQLQDFFREVSSGPEFQSPGILGQDEVRLLVK